MFKKIAVTPDFVGSRLDRFLKRHLVGITQGRLEKILREKSIKVNGAKVKSSHKLDQSDIIEIKARILDDYSNADLSDNFKQKPSENFIAKIKQAIIFSDEHLLAINKPAKIAVQGGSKIAVSIDDSLPYIDESAELRLVHRLDKNTSGVLLLAKNINTARLLQKAFKEKAIEKTYIAIVFGEKVPKKGVINFPIKKKVMENVEKMAADEDGDEAITEFKLISRSGEFALVEFKPITGRMHQIRVHAALSGFPVVGDKKYNRGASGLNLYLHSYLTKIFNLNGKNYCISAELPVYFKKQIEKLGLHFHA